MMKHTTLTNLNNVAKFLIKNAGYATRSECVAAKQKNLVDLAKFAICKEKHMISNATGINVENICKTTRQLNWLANEVGYGIRKLFRTNESIRYAWDV